MSFPLNTTLAIVTIEQSNGCFSAQASNWVAARQNAQNIGYSCQIYQTNEVTSSWYEDKVWKAIQKYHVDGADRCNWKMDLAAELLTRGISANIIHSAYGGQPLSSWIRSCPDEIWTTRFRPFIAGQAALLVTPPTYVINLIYQGEGGVGTFAGTWDEGAEIVEDQVHELFPTAYLRSIAVQLPPGETLSPPGIVAGQKKFAALDCRRGIACDTNATFWAGAGSPPAGQPTGLHTDVPSNAHLAVLVADEVARLLANPLRRSHPLW